MRSNVVILTVSVKLVDRNVNIHVGNVMVTNAMKDKRRLGIIMSTV